MTDYAPCGFCSGPADTAGLVIHDMDCPVRKGLVRGDEMRPEDHIQLLWKRFDEIRMRIAQAEAVHHAIMDRVDELERIQPVVTRDEEILEIFNQMAEEMIRINRSTKAASKIMDFIDKRMAQLCGVLGRK